MTKPAGNKNCLPADTGRQKNLHNKRIPVFLTLCLSQRLEYQADCWLGHKPLQRRERSGIAPLIMRLFAPDKYYYFFVLFKSYTLLLRMSTYFLLKYTVYFQFIRYAFTIIWYSAKILIHLAISSVVRTIYCKTLFFHIDSFFR